LFDFNSLGTIAGVPGVYLYGFNMDEKLHYCAWSLKGSKLALTNHFRFWSLVNSRNYFYNCYAVFKKSRGTHICSNFLLKKLK